MSWDKNTRRTSEIDTIIKVLKELDVKYSIEIIGEVRGYGLNDDYSETYKHQIRKLTYNNFVVLEQMIRNEDCDFDDVIISQKFDKKKVPKKWEIEKTMGDS